MRNLRSHIILLFLCCCLIQLTAQSIRTEFGKNRVQYTDDFDKWWEYETQNFIVYWYGKGRNVAQSAVQIAESSFPLLQNLVEHRINDKIEIIVYADLADLRQSNIGVEETFETKHGRTKVIGTRIFVYFDGNHQHLQRRIREGIAEVFFNSMYAQGQLQEIVNSDPDLMIPDWYREGFISYAGATWDYLMEDELRDLWNRKSKYHKFNKLANEYPRVAGHSMWHYLAEEYGQTSVTTLLYLMRLRNDLDENIEFIFGFSTDKLKRDWATYYTLRYKSENNKFESRDSLETISQNYNKWFPKSQLKLSPNGQFLIYTVNRQGKSEVFVWNVSTGEKKKIFRHGSRNTVQQPDYNYPTIAWHPSRPEITIAYENRNIIVLRKVDVLTEQYGEHEMPENIQRVYGLDYIADEEYMMNGALEGYSELFTYRTRSRNMTPITEDYYDDIDASYVQIGGQWGILFSSNRLSTQIIPERLDTVLPTSNFDIFFLPTGSDFALRLTNTPEISEEQPKLVNGHYITYLSSYTGVQNQWVIDLNSRRSPYIITNYDRNIITHESNATNDVSIRQIYNDGQYQLYIDQPNWNESGDAYYTSASKADRSAIADSQLENEVKSESPATGKFVTRFSDPTYIEPLETNARYKVINRDFYTNENIGEAAKVIKFVPSRAVASRRKFKIEEMSLRADNSVLFEGLETYAGRDEESEIQQPGILLKLVSKDMFEDFKVEMGGRFPFDFKGSEFFASFDDKRRRIDRRTTIYRKQRGQDVLFGNISQRQRSTTLLGLHRLSYPFDTYRSVRATAQLRYDQLYFLNSDPIAAEAPRFDEQRASAKLEYIFDNSLDIDLNLRVGTRYKAFVEVINRFDLQVFDGFKLDPSIGFTTIVGFDARHYVPVLRNSILAFRAAGASSFGSNPMLYYVGGTDGWISPGFDNEIPVPAANYAFRVNAPNLRGFDNNTRNGKTFLLGSAELRIPIFKYLSSRELKSNFLRNIQVTAFFDTGSAWHSFIPNSKDNPLNVVEITDTPGVTVRLNLDRNIFVYGYGVGARINLLGYFIRADYAWGVESGIVSDPKLHISLGTDF